MPLVRRKGRNGPFVRSMSRADVAPHIKKMINKYYKKYRYSCHEEVGVGKWGRIRADLLAINMQRSMIIVEVKSCWQDFNTDKKWSKYLALCDKFYFAFLESVWEKEKHRLLPAIKGSGAGIILVPEDGRCVCRTVLSAKTQTGLSEDTRLWLLTKLACKAGSWSKK